jgi:hypothetical protein
MKMVMEVVKPERPIYKDVVARYEKPRTECPIRWSKMGEAAGPSYWTKCTEAGT